MPACSFVNSALSVFDFCISFYVHTNLTYRVILYPINKFLYLNVT